MAVFDGWLQALKQSRRNLFRESSVSLAKLIKNKFWKEVFLDQAQHPIRSFRFQINPLQEMGSLDDIE